MHGARRRGQSWGHELELKVKVAQEVSEPGGDVHMGGV